MAPPGSKERSGPQPQSPPSKRGRKFYRQFTRHPQIQHARQSLPVCMHEQEIIEAIHENDVTVVVSTTGSGKTTQIPQFLLEDGFGSNLGKPGMIAVTQPRRIAAISCAERVAHEISSRVGQVVGYHTRHRSCLGPDTNVKFCTDGILLKEVEADLTLSNYSAVIVDEIHERSLNTDLILSLLSRTILLRKRASPSKPFKVILMSATIDDGPLFDGLRAMFSSLKVIDIPSRSHPVTIHYSRETPADYIQAAENKVTKIHRKLPPGAILVFLSGREEVRTLCSLLATELCSENRDNVVILPLFSTLPAGQQKQVFEIYPKEVRKIIVATNIAETSITIPDVTYIVDSGKCKEISWMTGLVSSSFLPVEWISKSSAEQRAGRAGRTGPGHCYRLYSSPVFHGFKPSRTPEILRIPVESLVLRLKAMGVSQIDQFPFLTKPSSEACETAEETLRLLGALSCRKKESKKTAMQSLTETGLKMARLPVSPRIARGLLAATGNLDTIRYACRLAGMLSVGTIWNSSMQSGERTCFESKLSDLGTGLQALCEAEKLTRVSSEKKGDSRQFCERYGLNYKAVVEALSITGQLEKLLLSGKPVDEPLPGLSRKLEEQLLRCFCRGFGDQLARKMHNLGSGNHEAFRRYKGRAYALSDGAICILDRSSSVKNVHLKSDFVCYVRLERKTIPVAEGRDGSANGDEHADRDLYVMKEVTSLENAWIADLCPTVCYVKPVNPSNPTVSYVDKTQLISILCKQMYRGWTVGEVDAAAGKYFAESSDDEDNERIWDNCLEVFARAIIAGRVKLAGGKSVPVTTLPKYVAVQRLVAKLRRNGAPLSARRLNEELEQRGDFLRAALTRITT